MTNRTVWHNLYWQTWKGILLPEVYVHPAKFAPGLIEQIYRYIKRDLKIAKGSIILDPFAGVSCGALYALLQGYIWLGHEIESKFYYLGLKQIQHWENMFSNAYDLGQAYTMLKDSAEGPYRYTDRTAVQGGEISSAMSRAYTQDNQGSSHKNLARLKENRDIFDAIVSSPPYEDVIGSGEGPGARFDNVYHSQENMKKISSDPAYGNHNSQLGSSAGKDFWSQAQIITSHCFNALTPGGYAIWVCKDYVRKGARVPFSDNWEALCQSVGFEPYERIEASLIMDNGTQTGMFEDRRQLKERKTFFRKLAERRGSPEINHEDVIVMRKPEVNST